MFPRPLFIIQRLRCFDYTKSRTHSYYDRSLKQKEGEVYNFRIRSHTHINLCPRKSPLILIYFRIPIPGLGHPNHWNLFSVSRQKKNDGVLLCYSFVGRCSTLLSEEVFTLVGRGSGTWRVGGLHTLSLKTILFSGLNTVKQYRRTYLVLFMYGVFVRNLCTYSLHLTPLY